MARGVEDAYRLFKVIRPWNGVRMVRRSEGHRAPSSLRRVSLEARCFIAGFRDAETENGMHESPTLDLHLLEGYVKMRRDVQEGQGMHAS